mgnify:CR=1 FL=1
MPLTSTYQARANKKYRENNREKVNKSAKEYYTKNKEVINAKRKTAYQRRKAAKLLLNQQATLPNEDGRKEL